MTFAEAFKHCKRAGAIQRSLGTRAAAGYLRNRGHLLRTALILLAGQYKERP